MNVATDPQPGSDDWTCEGQADLPDLLPRPKMLDLESGIVILDEDDFLRLGSRSVYVAPNGYAYFSTNATGPITLHSFILGGAVAGMHIDHINGDKLDNRRVNLRVVTHQRNQVNRKRLSKANTSGIRGVSRTKASSLKPWLAQITVDRKNIYLGIFATLDEAMAARKAAELNYFGEECP